MFSELDKKENAAKKISLPTPKIAREGKKTFLANFKNICDTVSRPMDHLQWYIATEFVRPLLTPIT
jgi:translation initiation factor 2 beta subunit (eIF-2beta)/eIF-5